MKKPESIKFTYQELLNTISFLRWLVLLSPKIGTLGTNNEVYIENKTAIEKTLKILAKINSEVKKGNLDASKSN